MSGKKKKKRRAKRKAQEEQYQADVAMGQTNWENMGQWQHEATQSRDKNVQGINLKYGAENQKLRDILVGEEDRKFDATMKDLNEGATGTQLAGFYSQYGGKSGMDQQDYLTQQFGEFTPEAVEDPAGEEAAKGAAAGRAPKAPTEEEGKSYFGW